MFCNEKCVFKASERLLFSLLIINQIPNVLLQKMYVKSKREAAF